MSLVRLYIRVLALHKPNAALAWSLAVANLALAAAQDAPASDYGVMEETPNQRRHRVASAQTSY